MSLTAHDAYHNKLIRIRSALDQRCTVLKLKNANPGILTDISMAAMSFNSVIATVGACTLSELTDQSSGNIKEELDNLSTLLNKTQEQFIEELFAILDAHPAV